MPYRDALWPIASSRTLLQVSALALAMGLYALIPTLQEYFLADAVNISSQFHAVLSLVLGWLLVFRTNTAYQRWWEARTLWGALVNACRNLAIKFTQVGDVSRDELPRVCSLITAFPVALKVHLRDENETKLPEEVRQLAPGVQHVPQEIARQLYEIAADAKQHHQIDGDELRVLDAELLRLMDICGGCERILRTRIVKSYRVFARQCVMIFLVTLPWGTANDFGFWAIPMTIIAAYFMLGLEVVAEHVEEPFGYDEDDLDLESLCETIGVTVQEVFHQSANAGLRYTKTE